MIGDAKNSSVWKKLPCGAFVRIKNATVEVCDGGFTGISDEIILKEASDATGLRVAWRYPQRHLRWRAASILATFLNPNDPIGSLADLSVETCEVCAERAGSQWVRTQGGGAMWVCKGCSHEVL